MPGVSPALAVIAAKTSWDSVLFRGTAFVGRKETVSPLGAVCESWTVSAPVPKLRTVSGIVAEPSGARETAVGYVVLMSTLYCLVGPTSAETTIAKRAAV